MATMIRLALTNLSIILVLIAIIVAVIKVRRGTAMSSAEVFFAELIFYSLGLGGIYDFIGHAFMQQIVAPSIGWAPSPFEWELAWATLGTAAVAIVSLWAGRPYRIAVTIMTTFFLWGAAIQHINQIRCCANYTPGNAGTILYWDVLLPVVLIALALASRQRTSLPSRR